MSVRSFWDYEIKRNFSWKSPILYLLLLLPLGYTLLFGFIYQENVVNHIPMAIYDADNTNATRSLVNVYATSERFHVMYYPNSLEELTSLVENGQVYTGVYIPPNFTKDIKTGKQSSLGIYINSSNIVFNNAALASHKEITTAVTVKAGQKLSEAIGKNSKEAFENAYPIHLRTRILYNPTTSYSNFMLLGLIANGIQVSIFLVATNALCREYKKIFLLQHIASRTIVSIRFLFVWALSSLGTVLSCIVANMVFEVPFKADLWQFAILIGAFTFLFTAFCFFVSAAIPNSVVAMQIPLVYVMPGLLYSGLSWPVGWMDKGASILSSIMPITYFVVPLRELSLRGYTLNLGEYILGMMVVGILLLLFSAVIFSKWRKYYKREVKAYAE